MCRVRTGSDCCWEFVKKQKLSRFFVPLGVLGSWLGSEFIIRSEFKRKLLRILFFFSTDSQPFVHTRNEEEKKYITSSPFVVVILVSFFNPQIILWLYLFQPIASSSSSSSASFMLFI